MSKTKTVGGKDYRWDYKNKRWVESHGASGGEALGRFAKGVGRTVSSLFKKKDKNKDGLKKNTTKSTPKSTTKKPKVKSVGTVDFNVNTESGRKGYNKALAASKTSGAKTDKEKDKSTTEALHGKSNERAKWLHKTRNSPAAKAGFSDEERWQQQLRHRAWKESRNKKTSTPKPTPKVKSKAKVTPKKKKKKQDLNFTTM